jgi:hypothetical protein
MLVGDSKQYTIYTLFLSVALNDDRTLTLHWLYHAFLIDWNHRSAWGFPGIWNAPPSKFRWIRRDSRICPTGARSWPRCKAVRRSASAWSEIHCQTVNAEDCLGNCKFEDRRARNKMSTRMIRATWNSSIIQLLIILPFSLTQRDHFATLATLLLGSSFTCNSGWQKLQVTCYEFKSS